MGKEKRFLNANVTYSYCLENKKGLQPLQFGVAIKFSYIFEEEQFVQVAPLEVQATIKAVDLFQ